MDDLDLLFEACASPLLQHTEGIEFIRPVAYRHAEKNLPSADDVNHGDVLCDAHGIIEGL